MFGFTARFDLGVVEATLAEEMLFKFSGSSSCS